MPDQLQQLNDIASEYHRCTFWQEYVRKTGELICPKVKGKTVLEMGCSTLVVSEMLVNEAAKFDIVEGASSFAELACQRFGDRVAVHHSLFEDFNPEKRYDVVVLTNTLHHLDDPGAILDKIKNWLADGALLLITVPNMHSLHRLIGVEMGLLTDVFSASERNVTFAQSGRYTKESLRELCVSCGYRVVDEFGYFLKPFSDAQMESLRPGPELIEALFRVGRQYPEIASLLYIELMVASR